MGNSTLDSGAVEKANRKSASMGKGVKGTWRRVVKEIYPMFIRKQNGPISIYRILKSPFTYHEQSTFLFFK